MGMYVCEKQKGESDENILKLCKCLIEIGRVSRIVFIGYMN